MPEAAPTRDGARPLWDRILCALQGRIPARAFDTWLRPTAQKSIVGGRLVVEVPSAHFADWIGRTYSDEIREAMDDAGAGELAVQFTARDTKHARTPAAATSRASAAPAATSRADVIAAYKAHPITFRVSAGLIDPKHRRAMSGAVWTYLWCLDKQTGPDGLIYSGRPVTISEIAASLAFTPRHTSRQLDRLVQRKYVTVERRPEGLVLRVNWQKKFPSRAGSA